MEKISGILPSSARVASVDMKEANPVRPGTPSFGRPEGVSSLRDAKIGQTASRAAKINEERLDWRSKDLQNAAVANEISTRFFKGKEKAGPEKMVDIDEPSYNLDIDRKSNPAGFKTDDIDRVTGSASYAGTTGTGPSRLRPEITGVESIDVSPLDSKDSSIDLAAVNSTSEGKAQANEQSNDQPNGLYPRGSFIDFRA